MSGWPQVLKRPGVSYLPSWGIDDSPPGLVTIPLFL
jgi:hypothetical protein